MKYLCMVIIFLLLVNIGMSIYSISTPSKKDGYQNPSVMGQIASKKTCTDSALRCDAGTTSQDVIMKVQELTRK